VPGKEGRREGGKEGRRERRNAGTREGRAQWNAWTCAKRTVVVDGLPLCLGMMPYEKYEAWKVSHALALQVYSSTEGVANPRTLRVDGADATVPRHLARLTFGAFISAPFQS